jgi:glycosyltransferase involved in cell wall biosynthesis
MTRIPVLMITNGMGLGGVEKTVIAFAKAFDARHFEVHIGCFLSEGVRTPLAQKTGLPYIFFNGNTEALHEYLVTHHIAAIHSHEQGVHTEALFQAVKDTSVRCVIQSNVFSLANPSDHLFDRQLFISTTNLYKYNWIYSLPFDVQKRAVLYNPIDFSSLDALRLSKKQREAFRQSLGIQPQHIVLGKIARKTLGKWSDLNLDILPSLVKRYPQVRFLVLGLPDSRWQLALRMKVDHVIIRVEETTDLNLLSSYYQSMDILAHFSKIGECCSAAIQEAMTFRLPVVTNSTPFTRKRFRYVDNGQIEQVDSGQTGYVVNTPRAIVAAIGELIENPAKRVAFGEAGRVLAEKRYTITDLTKQLEKATAEILASKGDERAMQLAPAYTNVTFSPSEAQIQQYNANYPVRATGDVLPQSLSHTLHDFARVHIRNRGRFVRDQIAVRLGREKQS